MSCLSQIPARHGSIFNPHALPINSCANNVGPEYGFSTPTENERSHMPYLHRDIEKKQPLRWKHSCCLGNKLYKNTSRRLLRCFSLYWRILKIKEKKKNGPPVHGKFILVFPERVRIIYEKIEKLIEALLLEILLHWLEKFLTAEKVSLR